MLTTIRQRLILFIALFVVISAIGMFAASRFVLGNSCDRTYGGGSECDKGFKIKKEVRIKDTDNFAETVSDVQKGQVFTFRIVVENIGDVDGKDLEMIDELPAELEKVDGSLTEDIEVIDNGDDNDVNGCTAEGNAVKVFCIKVKVKDAQYQTGVQKCVVNLARLKGDMNEDGNKETIATDTATVCYGKGITELPKTGASDTLLATILGLSMVAGGVLLKKRLA